MLKSYNQTIILGPDNKSLYLLDMDTGEVITYDVPEEGDWRERLSKATLRKENDNGKA